MQDYSFKKKKKTKILVKDTMRWEKILIINQIQDITFELFILWGDWLEWTCEELGMNGEERHPWGYQIS